MTACPLCNSPIGKESKLCHFCGSRANTKAQKMGRAAALKLFKRVGKAISEKPASLDLKVARPLLKSGQAALEDGDLEEASRAGRALQKALALAERRQGWLDKIAVVREEMKEASRLGVSMEEVEELVADLDKQVEAGQFEGLAKVLSSAREGISFSGKIKQLEKTISAAQKKINYARERGGNVAKAVETLEAAEEALRVGEVSKGQGLIKRANTAADYARKRAHASKLISGSDRILQEAADRGADVREGQSCLKRAQKALKSGIYADVQMWTKRARESADHARRRKIAEDSIQSVEKLLEEEAGEGSDVSEANVHLESAWKALEEGRFSAVQKSLKKSRGVADDAARIRKAWELLDLLEADLQELRSMKADTSKVEKAVNGAEKSLEEGNWKAFRQRTVAARRSARRSRRDREKELITLTVEKIVERAGEGGVSAMGARELLVEVEKALGRGRYTDIDTLVEAKFEAEATKKENKLLREIGDLKTVVAQLKVAGIEVSAAMGLVGKAEEALEASDFSQTQRLLSRAEEVAEGLREAVKDSAARALDDLEEEVKKLGESDVRVPQASEFQAKALDALEADNAFEALDLARLALEACRKARQEHFDEIAAKELEEMRSAAELEAAQERIEEARELCRVLQRGGIDSTTLAEAAVKAEEALKADDVANLNFRLRVLAEIIGSVRDSLRNRLALRKEELEASLEGRGELEEREADLDEMRTALKDGHLELALDLLLNLEREQEEVMTEALRQELGSQAQVLKAVSSQFVRVKALLNELSRAGIDVSDSRERLREAEAAIQDEDTATAAPLLTELEEVASDAKGSLSTAAEDVIASVQLRLERAAKHWERVPEAEELLRNARDRFEQGRFDETIEVAKLAELKVRNALESFIDDSSAEVAERISRIEERHSHLKEIMKDLSRADITIEGAEEALGEVEEALEDGDFERAEATLAAVEDMGESLASGLKVAAQDLLRRMGETLEDASSDGLVVQRGKQVFRTAEEAFEDGRYVETLEYCKVMEDIVEDARIKSSIGDIASYLDSIKADLRKLETKGISMSRTMTLLDDIEEVAAKGDLREAKLLADSLGTLLHDIQTAPALGASVDADALAHRLEGAQELLLKAQELIDQGDTAEVKEIIAKVLIEVGQGEEGAEALIADTRKEMDLAKRLGADVKEAEKLISEAETSMEDEPANAVASLDKAKKLLVASVKELVKEAEPELSVKIPEEGLEEGIWNRYLVSVRNTGKAPARDVDLTLRGDLETRGLTPLESIAPDEVQYLELEVKPKASGEVPVELDLTFRQYFDRGKVAKTEQAHLKVSPSGTYVVEDIFLVHSDGRLVNHQSRKPLDEIDEDIFSGMLTVVQDFVRDSFRQRTTVGLKRLEFGESKIIIERGAFVYLACVLLGEEPKLLPLYMAEIINDIEREYGERLEKWSGLLSELKGIETVIRKLIFYTAEEVIRGPSEAASTLSSAMSLIAGGKALGLDLSEPEELITAASKKVSKEPDAALVLLQDAVEKALKTQQELQKKLASGLEMLEGDMSDLATLGMKHEEGPTLVERARRALARGEYDLAARILTSLDDSVSALKEQVISKRIDRDLVKISKTLISLDKRGADVADAMQVLEQAKVALEEGRIGEVTRRLEEADSIARERRRSLLLESYGEELQRITSIFDEATAAGVAPKEAEEIIHQAKDAADRSDVDELELLVTEARQTTLAQIEGNLRGKEPRLLVKIPPLGLQAGAWNRCVIEVVNRGNWSARDVRVELGGDVKVKGTTTVDKVEPDETKYLELGLWPQVDREAAVDLEVRYKRSLDDAPFVMRDIREMPVAPKKSYPVEDGLLFLASGVLLLHESRTVQEDQDQDGLSDLIQSIQEAIKNGSAGKKTAAVQRIESGKRRVLLVKGERAYLAAAYSGEEPSLLPLYMVQLMKELQDRFGADLKAWKDDPQVIEQLKGMIRRLLLVTEAEGAEMGSLSSNPITASLLYGVSPQERRVRAQSLMKQVEAGLEKGGLTEGAVVLSSAVDKGMYSIDVDDLALKQYIEIVKKVDKAINRARGKAGLEIHWPIPRIAIRAANPTVAAAAESFRAMIMSHANAKQADILEEGEIWRGVDLKMKIHEEAISKAYKVWARKIELILKSQDPWKIKSGIDRGGYQMGIEGQVVRIFPGMVTFQAIVPPHVIVQEFPGGMVFLDTQMTEETKVEGFANEIIRIVLEARKELALEDSQPVVVRIIAGGGLKAIVLSRRDYIQEEVNAQRVEFVEDTNDSSYVVDCEIRDERFTMAVDPA